MKCSPGPHRRQSRVHADQAGHTFAGSQQRCLPQGGKTANTSDSPPHLTAVDPHPDGLATKLLLSPGPRSLLISGTGPTLPGSTRWMGLQELLWPDTGLSGPWALSAGLGAGLWPCLGEGEVGRQCRDPEQMRYRTGMFLSNFFFLIYTAFSDWESNLGKLL